MGKKPQKTKELWAAIAEASSTIDETEQQQPQPKATRKRGRPRKIIVKMESAEEKSAQQAIEQPAAEAAASIAAQISTMEKGTVNEEENKHEGTTSSAACMRVTKQEGVSEEMEMQLPKGEPSRSRARRKSKPRKSS